MTSVSIMRTREAILFALVAAALFALVVVMPRPVEAAISSQLDVGSTGADVVALQTYLAADPSLYPEGLITGYYGPLTQAAVMRFQARYGIEQVGRVGPITLAKLNALMGTPLPPSTGGDVYAPVMYGGTLSVSRDSATFRWTTNESAKHSVIYSRTWPFFYATAPYAAGTVGTDAAVVISGLQPNTTYYYVRESVDGSGNVTWTSALTFTTLP